MFMKDLEERVVSLAGRNITRTTLWNESNPLCFLVDIKLLALTRVSLCIENHRVECERYQRYRLHCNDSAPFCRMALTTRAAAQY
jgi:hypothetical protein